MAETASKSLRIKRAGRVTGDQPSDLELVSTQMLKVILTSRDTREREAIATVASSAADGVLVRDPASGGFEIIDDDELQAMLHQNPDLPELSRSDDLTSKPLKDYPDDAALTLVSARALRKVLSDDAEAMQDADRSDDDGVEFDPYSAV